MPFELTVSGASRGWLAPRRAGLHLYSPLTSAFIAEHWRVLSDLESHSRALRALETFSGLDRYLLATDSGAGLRSASRGALAAQALRRFTEEVFDEQSDFSLHDARLRAALARIDAAAYAGSGSITLVATLHGLAILTPELPLSERITIARPDALFGLPEQVLSAAGASFDAAGGAGGGTVRAGQQADHLLVLLEVPDEGDSIARTLGRGREQLLTLLRALRLYGDGRIALGPLAWVCAGEGPFLPLALRLTGRSRGVLVVRPEQEDELRAFCSLLARRMPREGPMAFAMRRFELGCERSSELEALSDHLLALRALLEPTRTADGLFASRLAALCASEQERSHVMARLLRALELERDVIAGEAAESAAAIELIREVAGHLRALLRDVICGHLRSDLAALADELTMGTGEGIGLDGQRAEAGGVEGAEGVCAAETGSGAAEGGGDADLAGLWPANEDTAELHRGDTSEMPPVAQPDAPGPWSRPRKRPSLQPTR